MIETIRLWWAELNKEYKDINKKFNDFAWKRLHSMIYLGALTISFAFYKLFVFKNNDGREALNILFDWSLVGFTFIFLFIWLLPLVLLNGSTWSKKNLPTFIKAFKWGAETTFDFFISFVFIAFAGVAMKEMDIPLIDNGNVFAFVTLFCAVFFALIFLGLAIFIEKGTPKKKEVLWALGITSLIFVIGLIYVW
jgi:hypothetical protein